MKVAVEEKTRYTAERIARTESARAWLDGYLKKYEGNERVAAHKWKLASRHPVFDICDMYAKADMYGLGKGVFPKDKIPNLPVHPHCLCYLSPVYKSELKGKTQKDNIKEAGDEWLKSLPKQEQYKVLGLDGLKAWQNGDDWRKYMRNYSSKADKSRLEDLNIKSEDDIIKEKITELAKKYKIRGVVNINPKPINISNFKFRDTHINKERHHNVNREEAETFMNEAIVSFSRWNGIQICYFGINGSTYINVKDKEISTAYKRKDYDNNTLEFIEEVKKYVKI